MLKHVHARTAKRQQMKNTGEGGSNERNKTFSLFFASKNSLRTDNVSADCPYITKA